jgi:hypothetical protein
MESSPRVPNNALGLKTSGVTPSLDRGGIKSYHILLGQFGSESIQST